MGTWIALRPFFKGCRVAAGKRRALDCPMNGVAASATKVVLHEQTKVERPGGRHAAQGWSESETPNRVDPPTQR